MIIIFNIEIGVDYIFILIGRRAFSGRSLLTRSIAGLLRTGLFIKLSGKLMEIAV